jgi:hypothetical protein
MPLEHITKTLPKQALKWLPLYISMNTMPPIYMDSTNTDGKMEQSK